MKYILILSILLSSSIIAKENKISKSEKRAQEAIEKILQKEKKFAKEQKFYQGNQYDLKSQEIDPSSLDNIQVIEPENDFDMDDVYD